MDIHGGFYIAQFSYVFITESVQHVDVLSCPQESFHKMDDMLRDPAFAKASWSQG
jgi:hypothetical protein